MYALTSLQAWLWLLALLLLPIDIGIRRLVVTRADLIAIRQALGGMGRPAAQGLPVPELLGAVRRQREERRSPLPQPATRPPASVRPAAASIRASRSTSATSAVPRGPAPRSAVASRETPATEIPAQPAAQSAPATTTAQLLAAKRKRRA